MKLKKVYIKDFKSIKELELPIKNNTLCLVGKNECGKTSIIEAISYLDIEKELSKKLTNKNSSRYHREYPIIIGTFEFNSHNDILTQFPFENYFEYTWVNNFKTALNPEMLLEFKRWGNGFNHIEIRLYNYQTKFTSNFVNDLSNKKNPNEAIDKFLETVYPNIELFTDEELKIKPASVKELMGDNKEFESFRRLLKISGCDDFTILDNDDYDYVNTMLINVSENFTEMFRKYYLQDKSIKIIISSVKDRFAVSIQDFSKKSFSIEERSPGFQYFLAFVINKHYLTSQNNKAQIFLLDEPGPHLHPHGSRDLLNTFRDIGKSSQIIYTTHNIFLTLRNDLDNLIYVEKDVVKGTVLNTKPYRNKYQVMRKELGILLNDSFILGDINVVVEGATEKFALPIIMADMIEQDKKYRELCWLNFYETGGGNEIKHAVRYLSKSLGLKGVVVLETDNKGREVLQDKKFKELMEGDKNWTILTLNEIFNDADINTKKTFEDLFPQKKYINAYNKFCKDFVSNADEFIKSYTDFPDNAVVESPVIEKLTAHYRTFFDEKIARDKTINKIAVMRILLDDINDSDEKEKKEFFKHTYNLIDLIYEKIKRTEKWQ